MGLELAKKLLKQDFLIILVAVLIIFLICSLIDAHAGITFEGFSGSSPLLTRIDRQIEELDVVMRTNPNLAFAIIPELDRNIRKAGVTYNTELFEDRLINVLFPLSGFLDRANFKQARALAQDLRHRWQTEFVSSPFGAVARTGSYPVGAH